MIAPFIALLSAQLGPCDLAATQQEMNRCSAQSARAAETRMGRAAAMVQRQVEAQLGGTNAEAARRFRQAQRAWVAYRDAQCAFAAAAALGGSLEPTLVADCLKDMNDRRAAELTALIR